MHVMSVTQGPLPGLSPHPLSPSLTPPPHPEGLPDAAWLPQWTTTWSRHSRLWFVQQQVTATAMFAWRRSVFLQYLLDFRLRLDLASTQRQIEHLPRNATRADEIYPFIYSFMLSLPSIRSSLLNFNELRKDKGTKIKWFKYVFQGFLCFYLLIYY